MAFDDFSTEPIKLIKQDGSTIQAQATVSSKRMTVFQDGFPVEAGEMIERSRPDGIVERYEVLDPGYSPEFGGIPAHYNIKIRNLGTRQTAHPTVVHNTYNNSGQVAAMGPNAVASGNTFQQQIKMQPLVGAEQQRVLEQLETLMNALQPNATDLDHFMALAEVKRAQLEAKTGNRTGVVAALNKAGKWVYEVAEKIGVEVVGSLVKNAM